VRAAHAIPDSNSDLAVLELMRASTFEPIAVAVPGDEGLYAPGTMATVAGWGDMSDGGGSYPNDLQEAQVPVISDADCAAAYPGQTTGAAEVCAAYAAGGIDTCYGDSGGPIVVPKPGGGFILIGTTWWGDGCARAGKPGVYSEAAYGAAFIAQYTS
jgi:secreted trypsin-like serine protease